MVVGGTDAAIGGVVAAPVSGGSSLVVSAIGLGVAAEGDLMMANGVKICLREIIMVKSPSKQVQHKFIKGRRGTVWNAKDKSGGQIDWEEPTGNIQKGQKYIGS